jgi:polysaccharide deacetylase 2 family uncharacterized protein YibQ
MAKTTDQLKQIAALAAKSGATVVIRNADGKTTDQLKKIAAIAPGRIIFDL